MFVPGYVENMIIILDACNMGPHQISINVKTTSDLWLNRIQAADKSVHRHWEKLSRDYRQSAFLKCYNRD